MTGLLSRLIPTAIVGALAPVPIIIIISLLISKRGMAKAVGFGLAMTGTLAVVGAIVLATASSNAGSTGHGSAVTGTILAAASIVFLLIAIKQLLTTPDPDAPLPKFMSRLDDMSPAAAAVFGVIIEVINLKQIGIYLGGVKLIVNAHVTPAEGWVALAILLVVIQLGVIVPLAGYSLAGNRATYVLQRLRGWLVTNNRAMSIVLGLVIGAAFLVVGVTEITA